MGELRPAGTAFRIDAGVVRLDAALEAADEPARTEAVATCIDRLAKDGVVTGWRDELLPVVASYSAAPAFRVERAAYPLLGAKGYGVHVNGYTFDGDELRVWVATRAPPKRRTPACSTTSPRASSRTSAGARWKPRSWRSSRRRPACRTLGKRAAPASVVSYRGVAGEGKGERVTNEVLFCYDIELPSSLRRGPSTARWRLRAENRGRRAGRSCVEGRFKPNVAVVTVDFGPAGVF